MMGMRIRHALVFHWIMACGLATAVESVAAEAVIVLPHEFTLATPESRQPLIVQEIEHGEVGRQLARGLEW